MSVYNGAPYLRESVDSILAQTFRDFEFLIINDGSTDDSRIILESYDDPRIRILHNAENIGLTRSLNRGLAEARGELIARQDADDVSHPRRLEIQIAYMAGRPEIVMVGSQARHIRVEGRPRISRLLSKATTAAGIRFQLLFDSPFVHATVVFRRKVVWDVLGGYDERFETSQDFELWSRLLGRYGALNLRDVLIDHRWRPGSVSANYSSANARRLEGVFLRNLATTLGDDHDLARWPGAWISATNPRIAESFSPSEVFRMIDAIYQAFPKQGLQEESLADVTLQHAAKLLLAARLTAPKSRLQAAITALRAVWISRGALAPEVPRALAGILASRRVLRSGPTSSRR
jgi:glycosyltransferase involved in cell wall biosynthesis